MPPKFKKGDQVVFFNGEGVWMAAEVGATAVVTEDYNGGETLNVRWDDTNLRHGQMHGGYEPDIFQLINWKDRYAREKVEQERTVDAVFDEFERHLDW